MSNDITADSRTVAQMRTDLQEVGRLLRGAGHLEPQTQRELASLLEELGSELDPAAPPSPQTTRLAETVGRLARSLHDQQHVGLLATARDRLEEAARAAEVEAPVVTGIVRRFIDVLGSIGI
jgi:uncharacterized protein DUF4404